MSRSQRRKGQGPVLLGRLIAGLGIIAASVIALDDSTAQEAEVQTEAQILLEDFSRYSHSRDDDSNAMQISVINSLDHNLVPCWWSARFPPHELIPRLFDMRHRPAAYAEGTPYRTLDILDAVLLENPGDIDALRDRALIYREADMIDRAAEELTAAIALSEDPGELLALRGLVRATYAPQSGDLAIPVITDLEAALAAGFDGPGLRLTLGAKLIERDFPGSLMYGHEEGALHLKAAVDLVHQQPDPMTIFESYSGDYAVSYLLDGRDRSAAPLYDSGQLERSYLDDVRLRTMAGVFHFFATACQNTWYAIHLEELLPLLEREGIDYVP